MRIEESKNACPTLLTKEQRGKYQNDGFLIIRGLIGEEGVRRIRRLQGEIEERVKAREAGNFRLGKARYEFERIIDGKGNERPVLRAVKEPWGEEPDFREVVAGEEVLDIVQELIGPSVYYHSSKIFFKAAGGGRRKPWHQDWAYWSDMNQRQVTVWIAIDESTRENGCIEVIPGSHKKGFIEHYRGEDYMIHEELIDPAQIVHAVMKPGDVLFFNVLTLHASAPNRSGKGRLCCIVDFDSQPKPKGSKKGSLTALRL